MSQSIRQLIISLSYVDKQNVEQQGNNLLGNVNTLRAGVDWYPPQDLRNTQQYRGLRVLQQLKFTGTIPIHYKGASYNIPLTIWLDYQFPRVAPNVFVTPTANMAIANHHKHVDQTGRVYLQYLHEWAHHSTLPVLIAQCCEVFSQQPPVYSKPSQPAARPPPARPPNNYQPNTWQPESSAYGGVQQQQNFGVDDTNRLRDQVNGKMRDHLQKELNEISEEIHSLMNRQRKIVRKKAEIDQTLVQSEEEYQKLQKRKGEIKSEKERLEGWLSENEGKSRIDVDSAVSASDSHAQQLFEATAEDYALSDVQYELEQCLNDELINLQVFLKHIRKVSRQQFFARALAKKLKKTMAQTQNAGMQPQRSPNFQPQPSPNFQPQPVPNRPPSAYNAAPNNMFRPPPQYGRPQYR